MSEQREGFCICKHFSGHHQGAGACAVAGCICPTYVPKHPAEDATVPTEAFDPTHPDHAEWVRQGRPCLADPCPDHPAAEAHAAPDEREAR